MKGTRILALAALTACGGTDVAGPAATPAPEPPSKRVYDPDAMLAVIAELLETK